MPENNIEGSQAMKPHIELALSRWADEYNKESEKRLDWDKWLKANQHLQGVKALTPKRKKRQYVAWQDLSEWMREHPDEVPPKEWRVIYPWESLDEVRRNDAKEGESNGTIK